MWKHKTKWLVRGGRKVKCYLCGKKILAQGDLFLFHGDTGYYSHQSCLTESTTISGNERRRAVKKIAVGAAVVGAIAAGAGKFLDVSSQSKNSPAAQTILTSQGLIPPALTSDPANPVPGQVWYRSDAGVMAHFDGVQNRVVYSSEINDGNVHVTSKGIINGLSVLPNDGTGWFGPDTTKGATAVGQYGGTYTQTIGTQEAVNYVLNIIASNMTYPDSPGGTIFFNTGAYLLTEDVAINPPSSIPNDELSLTFMGTGLQSSMIYFGKTNGSGFVVASTYVQINTCFSNIALIQKAGVTINSMLDITSASNTLFLNAWVLAGNTLGTVVNGGIYFHGNSGETQFVYIVGSVFAGTNILNVSGSGVLAVGSQLNWGNPVDASMKVGAIRATSCSVGGTIYINQEGTAHLTFMACDIIPQANFLVLDSTGRTYIRLLYNTISLNQNTTIFNGNTSGGQIRNFTSHGNTWEGGYDLTYYNPGSGSPSLWTIDIDSEDYTDLSGTVSIPETNVPPSIPTNPPVSGTTYQNTEYYAIRLKIPVTYSPTSTAAATLATGISASSTVTTSTKVSIPSGLTAADGEILTYEIVVPQNWYFELVVSNATIGTVEVQAA